MNQNHIVPPAHLSSHRLVLRSLRFRPRVARVERALGPETRPHVLRAHVGRTDVGGHRGKERRVRRERAAASYTSLSGRRRTRVGASVDVRPAQTIDDIEWKGVIDEK